MTGTSDDTLIDYADWLVARKVSGGRHVNRLICRAIALLSWLQGIVGKRLVGTTADGAQVTVGIRYTSGKRGVGRKALRHESMVPSEAKREVRPASLDVLLSLLEACETSAKSRFCVARNRALVLLLADSGIRREEAVWLNCSAIKDAMENGGRLTVRTSKRRGNPTREVPIPTETLRSIWQFIDVQRAILMRAKLRRRPAFRDHDWLFCTLSGKQIMATSISQLFSDLREIAGISERATAHMLRHRYITLQVVSRIKEVRVGTPIGIEVMHTILSSVASLSGHADINSLWDYVDWAYDEIASGAATPRQLIEALQVVDSVLAGLDRKRDAHLYAPLQKVRNTLHSQVTAKITVPSALAHSSKAN